ncbi:hypothetical protein BJX61DRAFT_540774 [Aspergillus egyptiacus]|nr:hypothetical protein BJX61DRAFT_540774 [Aspergillus egyptiacus]
MSQTQIQVPQGAFPVPPGEVYDPDFSNPWLYIESRAVVIAGVIICTLCLGLRVYTKVFLLHGFGWDDLCIIGAWVFSIVTQVLCLYGYANGGIGIHIWNITPEMFLLFQKGIFAAGIVYVPALALAKASLIILYYRIISLDRLYRWALYVIGFIVVGYSIAITFALIFACRPIEKAWNAALPGTCIDQNGLYAATAVTNTVTDVALIVVPIPVVLSLNMPTIQKIGLFFITVITSVIRLVTLFPFLKTEDKTYRIAWTDLWMYVPLYQPPKSRSFRFLPSNVEANFIIICACIPFLRHFLRRYAPKWIGEGSSGGRYFRERGYQAGGQSRSTARSWRRKTGVEVLQDEVELEIGAGAAGASVGSQVGIVKEVKWDVRVEEERLDTEASDRSRSRSRSRSPGVVSIDERGYVIP